MTEEFKYTAIIGPRSVLDERLLVARLIPHLNWRRHGIGCLQAYVKEGGDPELRVHIWHPDIVREDIADRGDIHDHRFTMMSTILHGAIEHTEYVVEDALGPNRNKVEIFRHPEQIYDVYQVLHARADLGARYEQVPGPLEGWGKVVRAVGRTVTLSRGESYVFDRGAFHRTKVAELAVTLVRKTNQLNHKAQILVERGTKPVHAFEPDDDFDPTLYLADAIEALEGL